MFIAFPSFGGARWSFFLWPPPFSAKNRCSLLCVASYKFFNLFHHFLERVQMSSLNFFFSSLKGFLSITALLGFATPPSPSFFSNFDRFLIVDSVKRHSLNLFFRPFQRAPIPQHHFLFCPSPLCMCSPSSYAVDPVSLGFRALAPENKS